MTRYGWTWFGAEDDPDERGTGWIEVGPLDEDGYLSGDAVCEIICRDFERVRVEHPDWIEGKERDAAMIVDALNAREETIAA